MTLNEFKTQLRGHPSANIGIVLPDGTTVPPHFHVTEVGRVTKNFVDCGAKFSVSESCVLQLWMASEQDDGHRLTAGKLNTVLGFADSILPSNALPVEVEYQAGLLSQYPVEGVTYANSELTVRLGMKHTACLARERCGNDTGVATAPGEQSGCCAGTERCCG